VHGSGSSRFSPRNRQVARALHAAGMATLLVDLLTAEEEAADRRTGEHRFDIDLLARRLDHIIDRMRQSRETQELEIGLFGASTGAAAALITAARRPAEIRAVVSRGGRPDLAGDALSDVRAPTLFIVGARDLDVLALNRSAQQKLRVSSNLVLVEGATHLFEEPGALKHVERLAAQWFTACFPQRLATGQVNGAGNEIPQEA
jgi:putative phosphoribosyl transferase